MEIIIKGLNVLIKNCHSIQEYNMLNALKDKLLATTNTQDLDYEDIDVWSAFQGNK
jgi:hypothetical protein